MQPSVLTHDEIKKRSITAIDALYEIAGTYYMLGRLDDAQHLLNIALDLLEENKDWQRERLKLLLRYGQVLIVEHALTHKSIDRMLAVILQARQVAEAMQDQQGIADALSLLGQAHYWSVVTANMAIVAASLRGEALPEGFREQFGEALTYQQQALEIREGLHDTGGMSESLFQIGSIYERWQEYGQAEDYYKKALQIANQYGHLFEKTEPTRHLAVHAMIKGKLEEALSYALQAQTLREEVGFKPYLPLDHLLLRDVYMVKGDMEKAQFHTQKASALAEEMGYTGLVASITGSGDGQASQNR